MRYAELQRAIGGISQKMLTQALRSLERDGLVQRTVHPVVPPKVEYSLTRLGRTLIEPLHALCRWSEKHLAELQAKDRKSTRLNSSHSQISYAVFCLKKKTSPTTFKKRRRSRTSFRIGAAISGSGTGFPLWRTGTFSKNSSASAI